MSYDEQAGKITMAKTLKGGRVVAEWKFSSVFGSYTKDKKTGPTYEVKVSIHTGPRDSMHFRAHGDCMRKEFEHSDIEQLRLLVEEELRFQYSMATGVVWEDWLEVIVDGDLERGRRGGKSSRLEIRCSKLKRGVDPATGNAYTVNFNGVAIDFPEATVSAEAPLEQKMFVGRTSEKSYIPATPENIAALDDLMGRLNQLHDSLSQFLRQDKVQASLTNIATRLPALPFPL